MFRPLLLFVVILSAASVVAADPAIVRAKVTKIGRTQLSATTFTAEILHVYRGDSDLKGKTFEDYWAEFGGGHSGGGEFVSFLPVEVGEVGLWLLKEEKGVLTPARAEKGLRLPPIRLRKAEWPDRYPSALKLVEVIEKYGQVKPEDRLAMVEKLAFDADPAIGYWAVYAVGKLPGRAAEDALTRLSDDVKLPVRSQIAVDEVLCRKGGAWVKSKEQLRLYQSWVSAKADEDPAVFILSRFSIAVQEVGNLDRSKAVELCITAAENSTWPISVRAEAIWWVQMHGDKMKNQEKPFQWLAHVVRTNPLAELRLAAAANMRGLQNAPDRVATLRSLLADEQNEEVLRNLNAALNPPPEK